MVSKQASMRDIDDKGILDSIPIEIAQADAVITDKEAQEHLILTIKVSFKSIITTVDS